MNQQGQGRDRKARGSPPHAATEHPEVQRQEQQRGKEGQKVGLPDPAAVGHREGIDGQQRAGQEAGGRAEGAPAECRRQTDGRRAGQGEKAAATAGSRVTATTGARR